MTQPLTTGQMTSDSLVLDPHTAAFFDEQYHTGKIEHFCSLHFRESPDRTFGGRMAQLLTGEVVAILQERNVDGAPYPRSDGRGQVCFLAEPTQPRMRTNQFFPQGGDFLQSQRDEFWRLFDVTNNTYCSLSRYLSSGPTFSGESLWRCHYEENMGVGCRLQASGECHLLEICPDKRPPHAQRVDVKQRLDLQFLGFPAKGDGEGIGRENSFFRLEDQDFETRVSAAMEDPEEELFQLIRFWGQSEEERCLEVLGCTNAVRKEAEALFREHPESGYMPGTIPGADRGTRGQHRSLLEAVGLG